MQSAHFTKVRGFTLLEMVLVVFILGILATIPLTFIENEDGQRRYEQSRQAMNSIREAVVKERTYLGQPLISGFVADNGRLPRVNDTSDDPDPTLLPYDLGELASGRYAHNPNGALIEEFLTKKAAQPPYYHVNLDGVGDTFEASLAISQEGDPTSSNSSLKHDIDEPLNVRKGFAYGGYLNGLLDSDGAVKDAWGDDFVATIKTNSGQELDPADTFDDPSSVYTLALSNPKRAGFEADDSLDIQLAVDEWSVPFSDVAAESSGIISDLDNFLEGTSLSANSEYESLCSLSEPDRPFELVMFVFRNAENGGGNRWINYVLAEISGDGSVSDVSIRRELGKTEQPDPDNDRIPVGRHVVALVDRCLAYSSKDDQDKVGNLACEIIKSSVTGVPDKAGAAFTCKFENAIEANVVKDLRDNASDKSDDQDEDGDNKNLVYAYIDIFPNTRPIVTPLAGLTSSTIGGSPNE